MHDGCPARDTRIEPRRRVTSFVCVPSHLVAPGQTWATLQSLMSTLMGGRHPVTYAPTGVYRLCDTWDLSCNDGVGGSVGGKSKLPRLRVQGSWSAFTLIRLIRPPFVAPIFVTDQCQSRFWNRASEFILSASCNLLLLSDSAKRDGYVTAFQ